LLNKAFADKLIFCAFFTD